MDSKKISFIEIFVFFKWDPPIEKVNWKQGTNTNLYIEANVICTMLHKAFDLVVEATIVYSKT